MKKRHMTWKCAKQCIEPFAGTAAVWAAAVYALRLAGWAVAGFLGMGENAFFCILLETAMLAPIEAECFQLLGSKLGILDECDRGFLRCSGKIWVWRRWWLTKISMTVIFLVSCIPMAVMFWAGWKVLEAMPYCEDGTWVMGIGVHLVMGSGILAALPMRARAMDAVLPMIYLREPHIRIREILWTAFRVTKGETRHIIWRRFMTFPMRIFPLTMLKAAPVLWAAESMEASVRKYTQLIS